MSSLLRTMSRNLTDAHAASPAPKGPARAVRPGFRNKTHAARIRLMASAFEAGYRAALPVAPAPRPSFMARAASRIKAAFKGR